MPSSRSLLTTAVGLLAGPPAAASAQQGLHFGAHTPGDAYDGDINGTLALEQATGRRVGDRQLVPELGRRRLGLPVQPQVIDAVVDSGRTPLLTWEPWDPAAGADQPRYRLRAIADGDFDAYIATWADGLARSAPTSTCARCTR